MSTRKDQAPKPKPDGRRLRSVRSRELIIEAMLNLVAEGILVPTAQQVAERADVGIRSVFRHFADMESIFEAANELTRESHYGLFVGSDRGGTLAERIRHAAEQHANAYESIKNVLLSVQARRWQSQVLQKNYAASQRRLRKDLDKWLPELASLTLTAREAVDAIASFETWHRLREHQGLSKNASVEVVVHMLELLVPQDSARHRR
jgi:AcrR family transcriptional regulator